MEFKGRRGSFPLRRLMQVGELKRITINGPSLKKSRADRNLGKFG